MLINAKNFTLTLHELNDKRKCPELVKWIDDKGKIDLGNPLALYNYNRCIFKILDGIEINLDIRLDKKNNLIPTAGLRRCIASIIIDQTNPKKVIEIGTGASAIMALLLAKKNVEVIATEINEVSYNQALNQIQNNHLDPKIQLIKSDGGILKFLQNFFPVDCVFSLPPYYAEKTQGVTKKKGFQGVNSELYSFGDDSDFSISLIQEWLEFPSISYLCILWKDESSLEKALLVENQYQFSTQKFEIQAGNRKRIVTIMSHKY